MIRLSDRIVLAVHSLASWIDGRVGDDRHLTTDPLCERYRATRPGSRLDRASRGVSCVPCMCKRAWGTTPLLDAFNHSASVNPDVGPRCPACRLGLATHDERDPQCIVESNGFGPVTW